MQSKIIPLAVSVATVFSVPTANAAIDDAGMRYVTASEGFGGSLRVNVLMDTNGKDEGLHSTLGGTRLWVNGDVDLGGGFSSIYYWEWRTGDDKEVKTDSVHAGLKGPFGEIRAGIVEPTVEALTPPADVTSDVGVSEEEIFKTSPNVIRWTSPNINGLEFGTAVQMVDTEGEGDKTIDKFDMAVSYKLPQGLWLGAGYESMNSGKNKDSSGIRIGAQYGQDNWLIAYNYRNYENFLPEGPSKELQNYNYAAALVDQATVGTTDAAGLTDAQLAAIEIVYKVVAQSTSTVEVPPSGDANYIEDYRNVSEFANQESVFASGILKEFDKLKLTDQEFDKLELTDQELVELVELAVAFKGIVGDLELDVSNAVAYRASAIANLKKERTVLAESETDLENNRTVLAESETVLAESETVLAESETDLENNRTVLAENETDLENNRTVLAENETDLENNRTVLENYRTVHAKNETVLENNRTVHAKNETVLAENETSLAENRTELRMFEESEQKAEDEKIRALNEAEAATKEHENLGLRLRELRRRDGRDSTSSEKTVFEFYLKRAVEAGDRYVASKEKFEAAGLAVTQGKAKVNASAGVVASQRTVVDASAGVVASQRTVVDASASLVMASEGVVMDNVGEVEASKSLVMASEGVVDSQRIVVEASKSLVMASEGVVMDNEEVVMDNEEVVASQRIVVDTSEKEVKKLLGDVETFKEEVNVLSDRLDGRRLAYITAFSDESKYYKDAEYSAHSMSGHVKVDKFTFAAGYQIAETEYHKLIEKSEVDTVSLDVAYRLGSHAQIIAAHTNSSPKRGASESKTYLLYRVDF